MATRVVVAMSGGVDSSVAAALLVEQGYDVVGITMKLWEYSDVGGNVRRESTCCSVEAMLDAAAVCKKLGIPHYVVDFQEEFRQWVIRNFIEEYLRGRTPNPCILCNTKIKWERLLQKAREIGAEYLATGHYARVEYDESSGRYLLKKGRDPQKDQSYALWGLTQESLKHTLFPLGNLTKNEVRNIARKMGLKTAEKGESQEICFVPDNDYRRMLREQAAEGKVQSIGPGPLVTIEGKRVGEHQGYPFYTIGQRRRLGVALGKPAYVVDIRPESNEVIIGSREDLLHKGLVARNVNWIAVERLTAPARLFVKIRYRDPGAFGEVVEVKPGEAKVLFETPQRAITPGQSVVFYDEDVVVGGGIIESFFD